MKDSINFELFNCIFISVFSVDNLWINRNCSKLQDNLGNELLELFSVILHIFSYHLSTDFFHLIQKHFFIMSKKPKHNVEIALLFLISSYFMG